VPDHIVPVVKAGSLQKDNIVRGNGALAVVAGTLANVHAHKAAVSKRAVAFIEDELEIQEIVAESFCLPVTVRAAAALKAWWAGEHELRAPARHFIHLSRVADYNEVVLFHAHNYRAGDRLYFMPNWQFFCTVAVKIAWRMAPASPNIHF
jgi:hypothetical protein